MMVVTHMPLSLYTFTETVVYFQFSSMSFNCSILFDNIPVHVWCISDASCLAKPVIWCRMFPVIITFIANASRPPICVTLIILANKWQEKQNALSTKLLYSNHGLLDAHSAYEPLSMTNHHLYSLSITIGPSLISSSTGAAVSIAGSHTVLTGSAWTNLLELVIQSACFSADRFHHCYSSDPTQ